MISDALFFFGGVAAATLAFRYSPALQAKVTADLDALKARLEAAVAKAKAKAKAKS